MAKTATGGGGNKPGRTLIAAATLLALLIALTAIAGQAGIGLVIAGVVVLGIGLVASITGQARWASILTRRIGLAVAGAGFVALMVGAAVSPAPPSSTASSSSARTPDAVGTTTQVPTSHPRGVALVPTTTPVVTTSTPPPPPVPQLAMTCPADGSVASPVFGQQITATGPYTVAIDYGDGDHYTNDGQHLGAIFSHTYHQAGSFVVTAVLTDATGQTASSSCTYSWTKPVVVAGGGSSGGSGSSGDTYTNVDGNQIPGPISAPVAPPGATAQCNDGTWSFSQHHQGTCSHHGGVARWLG